MYEEKHSRTWETLLVPDSKSWNEVLVSWKKERYKEIQSKIGKIPALTRNDPPFNEPEMEHKRKRWSAQENIR